MSPGSAKKSTDAALAAGDRGGRAGSARCWPPLPTGGSSAIGRRIRRRAGVGHAAGAGRAIITARLILPVATVGDVAARSNLGGRCCPSPGGIGVMLAQVADLRPRGDFGRLGGVPALVRLSVDDLAAPPWAISAARSNREAANRRR
jgi:hypothetical protein